MSLRLSCLLLIAALGVTNAHAQTPAQAFDPAALKGPATGVPNQVLVLGTLHLREIPDPFDPASLAALQQRLRAWKPSIIAVENLSGTQCAFMRQYPHRYAETAQKYCPDTAPAFAATGLDIPAATAEADRLLAAWPTAPAPAQRRHLAAVFLVGGETASALVQWLRLPAVERHAGDGLDAVLVADLEKMRVKRSEVTLIAAPVAAALGLERICGMDDHTAGAADPSDPDEKGAGEAIAKAWDNPATAQRMCFDEKSYFRSGDPESVMALYRAINDGSQARLIFDSDFGAAMEEKSPQKFGRIYLGYWETRNLRMASNIRDAIGKQPGSRTLVIVRSSHKWYLEAYLNQMHDIRIVSSDQVLR